MAGYNHVFQKVLIRQAAAKSSEPHAVSDQIAWLTALQNGQFEASKNGESNLISSTINGKSISLSTPQGMTKTDVMIAIELAIETLEAGNTGPITTLYGRHA